MLTEPDFVEKKIINIIPKASSFFRNEVYKNLELKATNKIFDKESEIINCEEKFLQEPKDNIFKRIFKRVKCIFKLKN